MPSTRTAVIAALAAGAVPASLAALLSLQGAPAPAYDVHELVPDSPRDVVLDPDGTAHDVYRVEVPSWATSMRIWTEDASHDVELYVNFIDHPEPYAGYWDLVAPNVWLDEEIRVDVSDAYSLEKGEWYVSVIPGQVMPPVDQGEVTCTLHVELVRPEVEPLALDADVEVVLSRADGMRRVYQVDVPDDLEEDEELVVELVSDDADVNLLAGPPGAGRTLRRPYRRAETSLSYERVALTGRELRRGLELHVYAYPEIEPVDELRATVRVARAGGGTLAPAPELPDGPHPGPLGRALAATVAVFGPLGSGSGVVVSPDGWVLTNAHVVSGVDTAREARTGVAEVAVGFDLDPREPVRPTVGAELVEFAPELDLALLRLVGTLDLGSVPAGTRYPAIELAPAPGPAPGEELFVLGYPMTGGSGTMVPITVTRGVHAGWSLEAEGHVLKTDAGTHSGASGGACVDAAGRLVGLPSASITDANLAGGIGFVLPLELVPASWRARFDG